MWLILLCLGTRITILLIYEVYSWCTFVLQQLKPYQMAHSVSCYIARTGFKVNYLLFVFSPFHLYCCAWGQVLKSVKFYLNIISSSFGGRCQPGDFQRPETHFSVTSVSFPVPQTLSYHPPSKVLLRLKRETPSKRRSCSQIRAAIWWFTEIVWVVVLLCQNRLPWLNLADFFSFIVAGVCLLETSCVLRPCAIQDMRCNQALKRDFSSFLKFVCWDLYGNC